MMFYMFDVQGLFGIPKTGILCTVSCVIDQILVFSPLYGIYPVHCIKGNKLIFCVNGS